jgi:CPA1 family monovalent cation:H+ antiporter
MLVVLTVVVLGYLSSWLLPTLPLAAAFTLGAVLAPPDTVTMVAEGDKIGLPRRVTTILTGESLVNDATALTLFSIAVATVGGAQTSFAGGVGKFFYTALVGIAVGAALSVATLWIRDRLHSPTLETSLVLLVPFTAFLLSEELGASGILAVVTAAFSISVNTSLDPHHQPPNAYRTRLQEDGFWPVLDFLLETFVFAYIGLQVKFVLADLADAEDPGLARTLIAAGVLLVVAIVWRLAAVAGLFGNWALRDRLHRLRLDRDARYRARYAARQAHDAERRRGRGRRREPLGAPTTREALVVGWTGMRGILTLAAAAAVPETTASGAPFPGRDAIQTIALLVTLGTLLIQGSTLRWVVKRLKLDTHAERAQAEEMRRRALELATTAAPAPATDEDFEKQRNAIGLGVRDGEVDEGTARMLIADIDQRQAASHTFDQT